jgi:hypothetical protein
MRSSKKGGAGACVSSCISERGPTPPRSYIDILGDARAWLACCLIALVLGSAPVLAQERGEAQIKAGFIYSFAKHTEWPNAARERVLCAAPGTLTEHALAGIAGLPLHEATLSLRHIVTPADTEGCHLLLLGRQQRAQLDAWLRVVETRAVLTVGDLVGVERPRTVINLFTEGRRVRYDLNLAVARAAGLKLNPRLINLADNVIEE